MTAHDDGLELTPIPEILADVRAGKPVVIIDARDRENEGDLMVAGELVDADAMAFMFEHGKGLVCLSLTRDRLAELGIPLQVSENTAPLGTNFTVSIDHRSVADCGATAASRALTAREASTTGRREDFVVPGYLFPLSAVPGGSLKRSGQTEGSVDLARIAGLRPAAIICEIMGADGRMVRGRELADYCKRHDLKITSVTAIAQYRLEHEVCIRRTATLDLVAARKTMLTAMGIDLRSSNVSMRVEAYVDEADGKEHLAFVVGEPKNGALVRIHSECLTGDIFGSLRCDCGGQLRSAFERVVTAGSGVIVYLTQEGRGIGLANKLRAYELQDRGRDTVDANVELGFDVDGRDYRAAAQILRQLDLESVRLMTNNPDKVEALGRYGVQVLERIGVPPIVNEHNVPYLRTKREKLGHHINEEDLSPVIA